MDKLVLPVASAIILLLLGVLGLTLWDRDRLQDKVIQQGSQITTLTGAIEAQNTAILDLQTKADTFEAQATAAARAALLAGAQRRAKLPAGHGPAVMNAWLRETFGRPDAPAP